MSDLTTATTATDLANALVGSGVSVSNVTYTGVDLAAGTFSGMGPVGFANGVVLGSGSVVDVVGPNSDGGKTTDHAGAGDADLNALAQGTTQDASVLDFDFVPATSQITFDYVFSSDEYNEFSNSTFNDVFAFLVNGTNCALTPDGDPVSINTINGGKPLGTNAQHPELLPQQGHPEEGAAPIDIEPDGLTVVLSCEANVNQGVSNHMKLAIADTADGALDSNVFLKAGRTSRPTTPRWRRTGRRRRRRTRPRRSRWPPRTATVTPDLQRGLRPDPRDVVGDGRGPHLHPERRLHRPRLVHLQGQRRQRGLKVATVSITVTTSTMRRSPTTERDLVQDTAEESRCTRTTPTETRSAYAIVAGPSHGASAARGGPHLHPDAGYSGPTRSRSRPTTARTTPTSRPSRSPSST